jgi:hypothetical protein
MSLKAFHLFFVTVCVLLMLVVAGWCFGNYRMDGSGRDLAFGVLSLVAAIGMLVYGRLFLRKSKSISFL